MKKSLMLVTIVFIFFSCRKNVVAPEPIPEPTVALEPLPLGVSGPTPGNFTSTHQRNLNIVYFIPTDQPAIPDYQKRLSELLIFGRTWFKDQMALNGYPNKTFGMFTDAANKNVKIITIYGKKTKAQYPYNGGSGAVQAEVNAYFAANPGDKTSDHTLVILPRYAVDANGGVSGGPFYGLGTWCFALDFEHMNIVNLGKTDHPGERFTTWFSAMMHELGHGLNLPHDRQKVSESSDPNKGMSLMWSGGGFYPGNPSFLTAADAAILNVNQIFNNDTKTYYGAVTAGVTSIKAEYSASKQAIVVSGKFLSSSPVTSIIYYNDPNYNNEGTGVNKDYNAITWESKPIGTDGFYAEFPLNEFVYKDNATPYELKVKLVHENGSVTETVYGYNFVNNIPVLNFSSRPELSKTGWTIASFSSQETSGEGTVNGRAATLIDGLTSTYWHSKWSSPAASFPHNFVVDMGSIQTAAGFTISQRSNMVRAVKDIDLLVSTDGTNFTLVSAYTVANTVGAKYFDFAAARTFRYFKVIIKTGWDTSQFSAISEVGIY